VLDWGWLTSLSLVQGWLRGVLAAAVFVGLAFLLVVRRDRRWWTRRVPLAVVAAFALLGLAEAYLDIAKPWPDSLSLGVLAWIWAGFLALTLLAVGWHRRHWWVRVLACVAATGVVLGAADGVNAVFGQFPTVGTALQLPPPDQVSAGSVLGHGAAGDRARNDPLARRALSVTWHAPRGLPAHGAVFEAAIPPVHSHFSARPAWIYLPPAYFAPNPPRLPVLELISGQPGTPRAWLDGGRVPQQMDTWAHAHDGLAPVVVMPDPLGSTFANPLCLNSRLGRSDTYLTQDVPAWVTSHLHVDTDHAHWAVGGMSFGGTCALQLAVAHPSLFPTLFDVEGQQGPTLGSRARTVAAAFGGNARAFAAVDPLHELAVHRYPRSAGIFVAGAQDAHYRSQQAVVVAAARRSGMEVVSQVRPGGHSWSVADAALSADLSWLATRMGILP
jgi:S-formylglutathione hydrolase FrmB